MGWDDAPPSKEDLAVLEPYDPNKTFLSREEWNNASSPEERDALESYVSGLMNTDPQLLNGAENAEAMARMNGRQVQPAGAMLQHAKMGTLGALSTIIGGAAAGNAAAEDSQLIGLGSRAGQKIAADGWNGYGNPAPEVAAEATEAGRAAGESTPIWRRLLELGGVGAAIEGIRHMGHFAKHIVRGEK